MPLGQRSFSTQALKAVRGMQDLLPEVCAQHQRVTDSGRAVFRRHGYRRVATPLLEDTNVFSRTLGEASDVVNKEMYTFKDKSDNSLTLRPEGTAGVMRAVLSNGLAMSLPQLYYYHGPMFRYERPQKGRYRQFHQIGVECIGPKSPYADAEVIAMGVEFLNELGITVGGPTSDDLPFTCDLHLNTLGDPDSRKSFNAALLEHFRHWVNDNGANPLSADSIRRLEENRALRILDSKHPLDQEAIANAPRGTDFMSTSCRNRFDVTMRALQDLGVEPTPDPTLVRGLDYYTHTAFEVVLKPTAPDASSKQKPNAILAGGRYDGLAQSMGYRGRKDTGDDIPSVGWAAGIERIAAVVADVEAHRVQQASPAPRRELCMIVPVAVGCAGDELSKPTMAIARGLRDANIPTVIWYDGLHTGAKSLLKKGLKAAEKENARLVVLIGEDEIQSGKAVVKDMADGSQTKVEFGEALSRHCTTAFA